MVYKGAAPDSKEYFRIYELAGMYKCEGTAYRYEKVAGSGSRQIGSIYLPERMFGRTSPERVWLAIKLCPELH